MSAGSSSRRKKLYWFAEADDCSDDTAAPMVDRPQLGRSFETAAYFARNRKFASIPLPRLSADQSEKLAGLSAAA